MEVHVQVGAAPTVRSAAIENAAPTKIVIAFTADVTSGNPTPDDFLVTVGGVATPVSTAGLTGGGLVLGLPSTVSKAAAVTVRYTQHPIKVLQQLADISGGSKLASMKSAVPVTNLVGLAPKVTSAWVHAGAPAVLELHFTAPLTGTAAPGDFVVLVAGASCATRHVGVDRRRCRCR